MIWRFKLLLIVAGLLVAGVSLAQNQPDQQDDALRAPEEKESGS